MKSTSLLYQKAKCKYKYLVFLKFLASVSIRYLVFLKFVASVSIRVRINIRIQSLVIQTCIEKVSCNIKYCTIHVCYTKKNINIAVTNIIQRPSNLYYFGMGITSDVVPGHGPYSEFIFCNRMIDTHFLNFFDDPTNYKFWTRPDSSLGPNPLQLTYLLSNKRSLLMLRS